MRSAFLLLLPVLLAGLCTGCGKKDDSLRVGMDLSYPPFESISPDGQPAGVSVDLARALAAQLGRPLRIENIPFTGLIPALKSGKIDLIISSMTANEERSRSIAFSDPYLTTGLSALLPLASTARSIADLDQAGHTIVVRQGTTGEMYARQHLRQASILPLEKESACVLEVIQGKADAFIYDQMSIYKNWSQNRDATRALLTPFQQESWAIGLRQGDSALLEQVNSFLRQFREQGGFERLGRTHLAEQKEYFRQQGLPFYF